MKQLGAFLGLLAAADLAAADNLPIRLPRAVLEVKIRGGWTGQMIGVISGAPTELRWQGKTIVGEFKWLPGMIENTLHQDDLYVEMPFAHVLEMFGPDATMKRFGEAFRDSQYHLFHANAAGRRNLLRGIKPPMSGHPKFNLHAKNIDFRIEADFGQSGIAAIPLIQCERP